jgi:hypothetical protein
MQEQGRRGRIKEASRIDSTESLISESAAPWLGGRPVRSGEQNHLCAPDPGALGGDGAPEGMQDIYDQQWHSTELRIILVLFLARLLLPWTRPQQNSINP